MTFRNIFQVIIFCLTFFLISCNSGYQKENNKWTWVSYNEAVGKRQGIIEKADVETFVILKNEKYAKDKNHVYFNGRVIEVADPNTFEIINDNGYSKDNRYVYLDWDIILNSNPSTFSVLAWPYSKDKKNIFCGNLPLNISNPNGFEVTKTGSGKTSTLKSHFIEINPEYEWLDTVKVNVIITGKGEGQTKTEKFIGYKKKFIAVLFQNTEIINTDLSVGGFSLGDSITQDFQLVDSFGIYLRDYTLKSDNRIKVSTICSHITEIYISKLTNSEFDLINSQIIKKLNKEPIKYFGITHYGLKLLSNELYWIDSINRIDYSLWISTKKDPTLSLIINSEMISDSIGRQFMPNYNEEDIEVKIIKIEEE